MLKQRRISITEAYSYSENKFDIYGYFSCYDNNTFVHKITKKEYVKDKTFVKSYSFELKGDIIIGGDTYLMDGDVIITQNNYIPNADIKKYDISKISYTTIYDTVLPYITIDEYVTFKNGILVSHDVYDILNNKIVDFSLDNICHNYPFRFVKK